MLDDFGLNATLEWLCKEFSILHGIDCHFEHDYNEASLSHEMKLDFFRICQESLTNVLNHDEASGIKIRITEQEGLVQLGITDVGNGFLVNREQQATGLTNIRKRAASINALVLFKNIQSAEKGIFVKTGKKYISPN